MTLIIDAHEDLAWNMATFQRDYTRSAFETRSLEANSIAPQVNGDTMLGWQEYQIGEVAIVFATLFASPFKKNQPDWITQNYRDTSQAKKLYQLQLDLYHKLQDNHSEKFRLVTEKAHLYQIIEKWQSISDGSAKDRNFPVGLVILMEGAEGIDNPDEVHHWWEQGVRLIGPAWHGNKFCGGTGEPGPLTTEGKRLLTIMAEVGFILDISHMDELSARQALDFYPGQVIASHANASSLIRSYEGNRHFSDALIRQLISRNGIMGIIPLNDFLDRDWKLRGGRKDISLKMVAEQIDHVCQLAGSTTHVGLGTDFDGGFGLQSTPIELESIADLQKLVPLLEDLHFSPESITSIMGQNWQRMLEYNLP